jgi:hypothetical protein
VATQGIDASLLTLSGKLRDSGRTGNKTVAATDSSWHTGREFASRSEPAIIPT